MDVGYLVSDGREVATNSVAEVTYHVLPSDLEFKTSVADVTGVHWRCSVTDYS